MPGLRKSRRLGWGEVWGPFEMASFLDHKMIRPSDTGQIHVRLAGLISVGVSTERIERSLAPDRTYLPKVGALNVTTENKLPMQERVFQEAQRNRRLLRASFCRFSIVSNCV